MAPNLQRPSLYTDYPYERIKGEVVSVDSVWQRAQTGDVQHGDPARYLQRPIRLSGIKVVHGTPDTLIPIDEARQFANAMAMAGISFEYQEHSGAHVYVPELTLPLGNSVPGLMW